MGVETNHPGNCKIIGGVACESKYSLLWERKFISPAPFVAADRMRSKSKTEGLEDSDVDIYEQDTAWLREADVVIAECTTPSLGVGYELAYAEAHGIPVHIFYNKSRANLSAMLTGNKYFHIHSYGVEEDMYSFIDAILQ